MPAHVACGIQMLARGIIKLFFGTDEILVGNRDSAIVLLLTCEQGGISGTNFCFWDRMFLARGSEVNPA